jgi:hypothetical protein
MRSICCACRTAQEYLVLQVESSRAASPPTAIGLKSVLETSAKLRVIRDTVFKRLRRCMLTCTLVIDHLAPQSMRAQLRRSSGLVVNTERNRPL